MGIYLDNAATTKVDDKVTKKIREVFVDNYGNASSSHSYGRKAREIINNAREKIAKFIGTDTSEIIFTSGGTESNNLALKGLALANPNKKHIITSVIEHPAILETCRALEKEGYKVDYIGVGADGIVDIKEIEKKIGKDTLVVSVMHVNNEIGTIQPVKEIGKVCKRAGVYFHTDAVQGFMKVGLDLTNVDLMSVSGHKVHAPKGVGFLYVKKGTKINPILTGGGQESGMRSGTENIPGIVGLAAALDVKVDKKNIEMIRDKLLKKILTIEGSKLNGSAEERVYNNINVSFYGIEGESLMLMLDKNGIYVSTGSACASVKLSESHVLKAIGVEELYIHGSLRLTLGDISEEDVDYVFEKIRVGVEKLREISPFKMSQRDGSGEPEVKK